MSDHEFHGPDDVYDAAFRSAEDVVTVGELALPTGQVVACDPFFCADAPPFVRRVRPGAYPVQLRIVTATELGPRVAFARVLFAPGLRPTRLEAAVTTSLDRADYGVESGLGSFMDERTRQVFAAALDQFYREHPDGNYYTDVLADEFRQTARAFGRTGGREDWLLHRPAGSDLAVAMFASGLGDGSYASVWGLTDADEPVWLLTDFSVVSV